MNISVIVCTYNRAESLRVTLESFCRLDKNKAYTWELLVVDNNSSDHTKLVCDAFSVSLPLRYIFEGRQGKTCAQNTAIDVANGELLAFTDDDVDVDTGWLNALLDGVQRHPDGDIFGGKVLVRWSKTPKKWVISNLHLLGGVVTRFDIGNVEQMLHRDGAMIYGANMAFRRQLFDGDIRFREDMGPRGREYMTHEETALICHFLDAGHQCVYLPQAVVHHRTPPHRATEAFVRKWFKASGLGLVTLGKVEDGQHKLFGSPGYLWRILSVYLRLYLLTRFTCPSSIWLPAEITMSKTWGMICGFRRRNQDNNLRSS